jgi:biotin carboxylase
VLAQEYIDGVEYIIDSVSSGGAHSAVGLFEYQKGTRNGRAFIYEKITFLNSNQPVSQRLREFAYRVLDELEIRNGASHMEVKINSRDEIVFIEVGARTSGTSVPRLTQLARADGKGPIEYVLDTIQGLPLPGDNYETGRGAVCVCIVSECEGHLKSFRNLEVIEALRSFAFMELSVKPGQKVSRTIDLASLAGYVALVHADPDILADDQRRLDELLSQGVLDLE